MPAGGAGESRAYGVAPVSLLRLISSWRTWFPGSSSSPPDLCYLYSYRHS